ncbi:MAG: tRNA lysidine(34) synthetase TilS [Acidobacteria bacterium]|nr:tRNA lysidine(34) synthetase TilS [Acidobacteriota bacterium]
MTTFERKLRTALRRLGVDSGSTIVAAVSGGADSTALLDALVRLRNEKGRPKRIIAAHLNHRLRGEESDGDEHFVRELAERLNVEFLSERIDVAGEALRNHKNLEATARKLRYEFLCRCAEARSAEYVMTAHSRDDQAETVLMRLMRGSGMHGLRGIHPDMPLGSSVRLLRPMLSISRTEVVEYCERRDLTWRTDSSNFSIDLTRNRVRLELLPLLRSFNPRIDQTLAREAELMRDDADCLDAMAAGLLGESGNEGRLQAEILVTAHPAIRRRALRLWLQQQGGGLRRVEAAHLHAIDGLLSPDKSGRLVELPGGWIVEREFNMLVLRRAVPAAIPSPAAVLSESEPLVFGDFMIWLYQGVNPETININRLKESGFFFTLLKETPSLSQILIRTRKPGDFYVPFGSRHRIKLKTLMIRHTIPCSARDTYPVFVTRDDSIVWAPGLPAAARFASSEGTSDQVILVAAIHRDAAWCEAEGLLRKSMELDSFRSRFLTIRQIL